jgi:hypothetical protein
MAAPVPKPRPGDRMRRSEAVERRRRERFLTWWSALGGALFLAAGSLLALVAPPGWGSLLLLAGGLAGLGKAYGYRRSTRHPGEAAGDRWIRVGGGIETLACLAYLLWMALGRP